MNRAQGKIRQRAFIGALVIPSAVWMLFSAMGADKVLDYDTGENRAKHEISEDAGLGTITKEADEWISDRVPFRSILLSINSGLDHVLEFPYNKLIEPILLKHAGGTAEVVDNETTETGTENEIETETETKTDTDAGSRSFLPKLFGHKKDKEEQKGYVPETPDAEYLPLKLLGTGSQKAIQGRNKWLFYGGVLDSYQGLDLPTDEEMEKTLALMYELHTICESRGIPEINIFYPNKESVYSEYMPDIEKGETSRMQMIENYAHEHYPDLPMEYIYEELLEGKTENLLYRKQDTHWTIHGALIGLNRMYQMLGRPEIDIDSLVYTVAEESQGDLFYLANLSKTEYPPEQVEVCNYKSEISATIVTEGNETETILAMTSANTEGGRLVVVGDSFMYRMLSLLACDFSSVYFVNWEEIDKADWSMFEQADCIVVEAVERNCTNIEYPLSVVSEHMRAMASE